MSQSIGLNSLNRYGIKIFGQLDDCRLGWFEGAKAHVETLADHRQVTMLSEVVADLVALDKIPAGSYVPGIVKSPIDGDRGDISAAWTWQNGVWTVELSRALTTGSETDVQFSDLAATHYFGVASLRKLSGAPCLPNRLDTLGLHAETVN